jgi:hypothetical protein
VSKPSASLAQNTNTRKPQQKSHTRQPTDLNPNSKARLAAAYTKPQLQTSQHAFAACESLAAQHGRHRRLGGVGSRQPARFGGLIAAASAPQHSPPCLHQHKISGFRFFGGLCFVVVGFRRRLFAIFSVFALFIWFSRWFSLVLSCVSAFSPSLCPVSASLFAPVSSLVSGFPVVGVSGCRSCASASASASAFVSSLPASLPVFVGCASGVDSAARAARPSARVFRVSVSGGSPSFGGASGRAAFAARSAAFLGALSASGGLLVSFPSRPCPAACVPSRSFAGFGSGSWGSVCMALGLGLPVLVFVPASLGPQFPAPARVRSRFSLVASLASGSWWLAAAAPAPLSLF